MTAQYHDALDRFEAKQRAMQAEAEPRMFCPVCAKKLYIVRDGKAVCPQHGAVEILTDHDIEAQDAREQANAISDLRGGF
jgi:uncharacterized Zn finger protein (UPF0148 family)